MDHHEDLRGRCQYCDLFFDLLVAAEWPHVTAQSVAGGDRSRDRVGASEVHLFFCDAAAPEVWRSVRAVLAQRDSDVVGVRDGLGVAAGRICVGVAAIVTSSCLQPTDLPN